MAATLLGTAVPAFAVPIVSFEVARKKPKPPPNPPPLPPAKPPPESTVANRITTNPDFETSTPPAVPAGWEAGGTGVTVETSTTQAHGGTKSGKVVSTAAGSANQGYFVAWDNRPTVSAGEDLIAAFWVYSTTAHTYNIGWDEYAGDVWNDTPKSENVAHGGTGWELIDFSTTQEISSGCTKIQPFVRTGSAVNLTWYVDDASVDNAAGDVTAPTVTRRTVDGDKLAITYNEALDTGAVPPTSAFAVVVAGSGRTVNSVTLNTGEGSGSRHVVLTLASAVTAGQAVTVAYTAGSPAIQDQAGNDAANYAATAVTNITGGSTVTTYLEEFSNSSATAPGNESVTGTGSDVLFQQTTPISPYSGSHFGKMITVAGASENRFARITNTAPDWDEGTTVWWGGAFYFPANYYADLENESRLIDLNSFLTDHPTLYLGVWRDQQAPSDDWEFTRHMLITSGTDEDSTAPRIISTTWNMPEEQWHWLEIKTKLSRVDGLAINEIWLNGSLVGSSTTHNFRDGFLMRSSQFGISSTGDDQRFTNLTLYTDRHSHNASALGPLAAPVNVNPATISGSTESGDTLTLTDGADAADWTGELSIAKQWQRADNSAFTTNVQSITGETGSTYVTTVTDETKYIRCVVTATNSSGSTASNSNVLGPITGETPDFDFLATITLPSAEDLSDRLRTFNIRRGRSGVYTRVEAGTANITYKNGDGAPLDPGNPDSPYYPEVRVLQEQYLARRILSTTYPRFRGRIERFVPTWIPAADYQEQAIHASDAFEALSSLVLVSDQATLTTALSGANNDLVFTAREAGGRGDDITVEYVVEGISTPLGGGTNEPIEGEATAFISTQTFQKPTLFDYLGWTSPTPRPPAVAPVVPVSFAAQGTNITVNVATNGAGAASSTATQIKAFLEADPSVMALVSIALAPGNTGAGTVTAMAKTNLSGGKWVQELTGDRIDRALDAVGWPAGLRDIDPGVMEVVAQGFAERDGVSALAHCQDVADSELGYFFISADGVATFHDGGHRDRETHSLTVQATFADANAGVGYVYHDIQPEYSHDHVRNRISVTAGYQGAEPQVVEDSASQLLYSPVPGVAVARDEARTTLLATDEDALAVAQAILASKKDAKIRFPQITLLESGTTVEWGQAVMGRDLGDLVNIRTAPPGHSSTGSYECYVEEIIDDGGPGLPWRTTFGLSLREEGVAPVPPAGPVLDSSGDDFVLDSATLGVLG